jgi:haloalkane dehalogenase
MNTGLNVPPGFHIPFKLAAFKRCRFLGRFLGVTLNLFAQGVVRYGTVRPMTPLAKEGYLAPYRSAALRESLVGFVNDIPLNAKHQTYQTLGMVERNFALLADKPTLLAWGLTDFVFSRAFLADFERRCHRAQVLALPRAGHCLLEDEPETVLQTLQSFLSENKI